MGRESTITADQVFAICDTIKAEGGKPTSRSIRERLGNTGSMGTINKLLQRWKTEHTRQTPSTLTLPPALQNVILDFMDHELTAARAALETELAEQQQEAADLASENERQADTIESLNDELATVGQERASAEGKAQQLAVDLQAAHVEAGNERAAAEHARTELAKALLRLEAMPRLEADLETVRAELATERKARTEAERTAAVLQAQKDDLHARVDAAEGEIQRLRDEAGNRDKAHKAELHERSHQAENEMARLHSQAEKREQEHKAELERVRAEATTMIQAARAEAVDRLTEARAETARLIEQGTQLQKRMDTMALELSKAVADAKRTAEEAAELRGRLNGTGDKA